MSPCHCQCQLCHIELQSKTDVNKAMMEFTCISVQELNGLEISLIVVNLRDLS